MSWKKITDYVVMDCPEFKCELDEFRDGDDQMMFIHLDVRQWSKEALVKMLKFFRQFREVVTCPLYAVAPLQDDRWVKFVSHFGFEPLTEVICENGEPRRLFLSITKRQKLNVQPEFSEPKQ